MPSFTYQARDQNGKPVEGVVEASGEPQATSLIRERGLFLTKIVQKGEKKSLSFNSFLRHVNFGEIVTFTRQLASMVTAGLQLPQALTILQTQITNPTFSKIISQISRDIEGGGSLGNALSKHPKLFSQSYISLIKAGESSGTLDVVLDRLAQNLEKDQEFRAKVKSALIYPIVIFIAMIAVVMALMIFVIPQLSQLYSDFGLDLPFATRVLIGASRFMISFWWLLIIATIGLIYGFKRFKKMPVGKRLLDGLVFKLPVFGKLTKEILLVEFTRMLGMLVGAGIHLLDALSILTDSMSNVLYKNALHDVSKKVEKGYPLGNAFAQHDVFPIILSQMVKVGEETGKLDESLTRLSTYFESESNQMVKGLTTAIEPIIMVILGIGVGFIVFSIITPIYNLTSSF